MSQKRTRKSWTTTIYTDLFIGLKILQIEKSYQEQIQQLKTDKQAEVDKYQQKYFDLLEQMKTLTATVEQNLFLQMFQCIRFMLL